MNDSDKDPEYKPSGCSESECEQFFDSDNEFDLSDTFKENDHSSEETHRT